MTYAINDAQQDPYVLESALAALPAAVQQDALITALVRWRKPSHWTLSQLKEEHGFGVLLGRPLPSFPAGRYEMYGYSGEPEEGDPLTFMFDSEGLVVPYRNGNEDFGGAFNLVPTDGTLFGALHQVLEWVRGEMTQAGARVPEAAPARPEDALAAVQDPLLRAELRWMRDGNPRLERSLDHCGYVTPLFVLRPDLSFVVAWEAATPLLDVAQVIVRAS